MIHNCEEINPEFEVETKKDRTGVKIILTCHAYGNYGKYRAATHLTKTLGKSIEKLKVEMLTRFKYERGIYNSETKRF